MSEGPRPRRVLISAFNCLPGAGSEHDVGWNWAVQAARYHEVWVLTRELYADAIREELSRRPVPNLNFVYQPVPVNGAIARTARVVPYAYASYLAWQAAALGRARKLHEQIRFDVAHHLTWATYRFPTFLAWMEIPFVWGPVGGAERAPRAVYATLGRRAVLGELLRDASNHIWRYDPLARRTANRASQILVTSQQTLEVLPPWAACKAEIYPAIGLNTDFLDAQVDPAESKGHSNGGRRLLFVGRLVSWKGCALAIRALAKLERQDVSLTVVGSGPEGRHLEREAHSLGLANRVRFLGEVPREEVVRLCRSHDAFVFPSLHDSGGIAVLEAMYFGLPVICLDLGGPALSVADAGIRVECKGGGEQVVTELARAFESVLGNRDLHSQLAGRARRRVVEFYDWERKAAFIRDLYESTAGR